MSRRKNNLVFSDIFEPVAPTTLGNTPQLSVFHDQILHKIWSFDFQEIFKSVADRFQILRLK